MDQAYPDLFSPFQIAGKTLRNRVVHTAIFTRYADKGRVSDRLIQHTMVRARGGAAMIVTEPLGMCRRQDLPARVACWNDDGLDGLLRWAEAIEGADCRLVGQLQDPGRGRRIPGRNFAAFGASGLPDDLSWTVPYALSTHEVEDLIDDFARSAGRLKQSGFSGVEISAAHGHLFHQFLSPWSNSRQDKYGGDLEGRLRIVSELIDAVRAICGADFILGLKFPGDDGMPGSIGPELSAAMLTEITKARKPDYIALAQGTHSRTLEMHAPDGNYPPMTYMSLYRRLRTATADVPLMALGRITDPAEADGIIHTGEAELIGLGRPLLTDPEWPNKSAAGRAREIRYCVSANKCWQSSVEQGNLACENNPLIAANAEFRRLHKSDSPKRVVIVGAGIAGLEAALAAARRGHHVTVLGRSSEAGGSARFLALLPGYEQVSSIYDYQMVEAAREGVRFELGLTASVADVTALRPDKVILATGSQMIWPRCLPDGLREEGFVPDLRSVMQDVLGYTGKQPGTAVVFDMDGSEGTYASVQFLHGMFDRAVLITPSDSLARETSLLTRQGVIRRFNVMGIDYHLLSEPRWTETFENKGALEYENTYSGVRSSIPDVSLFAYSTPRLSSIDLYDPLREAGLDVVRVGDCKVARDSMAATSDGFAAGVAI